MKHVVIYTDGACRGNPGPGGWGALLICGDVKKPIKGHEKNTTNNRMELMAAIKALEALTSRSKVDIYTDSQYVQKGISLWLEGWKARGWRKADKSPVKNADLWQRLEAAADGHEVKWHWVKGHSGHPENDYVDQLANDALDQMS
jgi:ribonuclease HI